MTILSSCSSDDTDAASPAERRITVEVTEKPLSAGNGTPKQIATRTDATTTATLNAFSMNYQTNQYKFTKSEQTWSTNSWPSSVANDTKIDFYAYNSGTFQWNSGSPYLSFSVDASDAFDQTDLLVATHKNIAYSDAQGKVSLAFDHACAAIRFNVRKTEGVRERNVVVKSVVLTGVKNRGEYHYDAAEPSAEWQNLSAADPPSYTLTNSDITLTTEYQELPCHYLFLPPQNKAHLTLTVSFTVDGNSASSHDFRWTSGTWDAGREHVINIDLGTAIVK